MDHGNPFLPSPSLLQVSISVLMGRHPAGEARGHAERTQLVRLRLGSAGPCAHGVGPGVSHSSLQLLLHPGAPRPLWS